MPPNLPALTLFLSTLSKSPTSLLPNLTLPTLLHLPETIGPHLLPRSSSTTTKPPTIRALVLDKDNTFTRPNSGHIPPAYLAKLRQLRTSPTSPFNIATNPHSILIVSNTAGSTPSPLHENSALSLESLLSDLKIPVFRQNTSRRKPFCAREVLSWFLDRGVVRGAEEVCVVGDRLGTDVLMAREMGGWGVWVRDGVVVDGEGRDYRGLLARGEGVLERYLREEGGLGPVAPGGEGGMR